MFIYEVLKKKNNFSNIECLVADFLLENQDNLENYSARYIAKQNYTAPSTITRLCQKIGYKGYDEFKKAYLNEIHYLCNQFDEINSNYPFKYNDKDIVIGNKLGQLYHNLIDDTLLLINQNVLKTIIKKLINAKNIYVCSLGVQVDIAMTFKDKMLKINKNVIIEPKMDQAFYIASSCKKDSVFIMISYSGETETLLRVAKILNKREITMIVITSYGENSLSKLASDVLYVSTKEKLIDNLGNFSMNLSTLFLLDILYANIFNEDYQTNLVNKIKHSRGFEKYRKSNNPILNDKE